MKKLFIFSLLFGLVNQVLAEEIKLNHQGPKTAFKALEEFKDHQLTVFASAPEVNSPVSIIAEPGGALYVLCDDNAGLGRRKDQGSILRLVDKDNDGKADVMTRFVANIDSPRGGQFVGDTLYVMHPPYVSSFRDTNSDGVADEHKVLAKGFSHDLSWNRGADHSSNDLKIGIDGWIYTAIGDFGAQVTGSDGKEVELYGGGIIRMRLDGSDPEVYAQGTRNTYDLAINHKLDILAIDNTNDGDGWNTRLHHLTPLAHMGYPHLYKFFYEDCMPSLYDHGGGSGVGSIYLQEPGFPEWFNNRFHTISLGRMYTHNLEKYEATFINNPITSYEQNKLLEIDVDGSSRLYFSTFENGSARTEPGTKVGRVLRAVPKGWKYNKFPDLKNFSLDQLISALDKGSNVLRQNSQFELIKRQDSEIEAALKNTVLNKSFSQEARIAALYCINIRNQENAVALLKEFLKDNLLREYALRALIDRQDAKTLSLSSVIESCLKDPEPRVRIQAIYAAKKLQLNKLSPILIELADDNQEKTTLEINKPHIHQAIPHTARRALIHLAPVSKLISALNNFKTKPAALAVLRQIHNKDTTKCVIETLHASADFESKLDLIKVLLRTYHKEEKWDGKSWWGTKPNSMGPYYKGVSWEMSAEIAAALQKEVREFTEEQQKKVLYQIRFHNVPLQELKLDIQIDPKEQLVNQKPHSFSQIDALLSVVEETERSNEFRIKAFRAALEVEGARYRLWCPPILQTLAKLDKDSEIYKILSQDFLDTSVHRKTLPKRIAQTFPGIVKRSPSHIIRLYCDMVTGLVSSPLTTEKDRERLVKDFREMPTVELLTSIATFKVKEFEKSIRSWQSHKDKNIAALANQLKETFNKKTVSESKKTVKDLDFDSLKSEVLKMNGDKVLGQKIFQRQSCSVCHSILPTEPQKGPFMGTIGTLFNREQLITHIVKPNEEVAQGFQSNTFEMNDGSIVSGFVTAQNDSQITVRSMIGIVQKIQVSEVKKQSVRKDSMMPAGLVNNLTIYEFASLIEYLQSMH